MNSTSLDEQETVFTVEATDRNTLHIFTNDRVWIDRLDKITTSTSEDVYGKSYTLDLNEFTFTLRPKRKMSDEERKAAAERLAVARQNASH